MENRITQISQLIHVVRKSAVAKLYKDAIKIFRNKNDANLGTTVQNI